MQLLVIDDDPLLSKYLHSFLVPEYQLTIALTGQEGLNYLRQATYDAIILDGNLPDLSGASVCYLARQGGCTAPILVVSGWDHVLSKIELLNAGADDYVTKPFHPDELKARLHALQRRYLPPPAIIKICWQHLVLRVDLNELHFPTHVISLPTKEAQLLGLLIRYPESVISRDMMIEQVWSMGKIPTQNTIEAHIKRLRFLLINQPINASIQTIRGRGYRWQPHPDLRIVTKSPTMNS